MQSVKISIMLGDNLEDYSLKDIHNNCLMSNVSVILCVPCLIKDNCYSEHKTVTEPRQCNYFAAMMPANTNKFGAYKRVDEKDKSQRFNIKILDDNIYYLVNVNNQMIGVTPNYCIPVTINAITVQGISYSDPYYISFNLNSKMALEAPESKNKSDYAFKTSKCIIRDEESCESEIICQERESQETGNSIEAEELAVDDNKILGNETRACVPLRHFRDGEMTFDELLRVCARAETVRRQCARAEGCDSWGSPWRLRLAGGGENSLNAASGWGTPPSANNNGNSTGNWGNGGSSQSTGGSNSVQQQWGNAGQRPPTSQPDMNSNKGNTNQMPPTSAASGQNWQSSPPNMAAQQGNNNSPPSANNGSPNSGGGNNGGNSSPNSGANGNVPPGANTNNGANTNTISSSTKIEQLNSMREALFSQDGWGGQHVNQDTNWDVPGSPEPGVKAEPTTAVAAAGGPPAWKPNVNNGTDLWEANLRNGGQPPPQPASKTPWGHTPTTNIGGTWGEDDDPGESANVWSGPPPPQQWAGGPPQHAQQWGGVAKKDDWGAWGEPHRGADPRLEAHRAVPDPRPPPPADPRHDLRGDLRGISGRLNGDMWSQHHQQAPHPNKMMPGGGAGALNQWGAQGPKDPVKGSGWEEPSPPAVRRTAGGFDDGTSLWAQRGGVVAGRGAAQGPGQPPQRVPPTPTKPDAVWGAHPQRNGSWEEPHTPAWPEREAPGWAEGGNPALGWPAPKPKPSGPGAWPEDIGEWGGPKPPQSGPPGKQLPKDVVWNSKQFRLLVEMGFKKEEVESALRSRDMNAEEALDMLSALRGGGGGGDGWRREEHFGGHHGGPFQPPPAMPAVSPAVVHKLLNQPPPPPAHHHHSFNQPNSGGAGGAASSGQPSTAQLRTLVHQIQMAVSAGYLNHQILNQPLAPHTLVLLNQLLQQIKVLQQLVTQHSLAISKANSTLALHCSVQITKAKQHISNLQNQIAAQQAIYVKQQAGGADLYKQGGNHDPMSQLQTNFTDITISKDPQPGYGGGGSQQSRLNQWKLPSLDKEGEGSEFSRAPGSTKTATSPQLNPLGLQPDSTWGVGSRNESWGEASADVADGKDAWPSHPAHQAVYDLVPEFEPGKPWKMKNVEDDPAMTPGSVVRSPLSLAAIKDTEMLGGVGGKASPPASERSLSSSTWSYPPPPVSTPSAGAAGLKQADAWGKARAPPPGLNKPWPHHGAAPAPAGAPSAQRSMPSWQSTWLLLKNLTAQIDGSTLKTLCMQHGPLQAFHLYLNQGIALARYISREEAAKAQTALNNCVLSNTTIFAESPSDSDVQMILQHLGSGGGPGGGGGAWRARDSAWGFPSLWSADAPHEQRATPSSLNSFLPPDLLGGESI